MRNEERRYCTHMQCGVQVAGLVQPTASSVYHTQRPHFVYSTVVVMLSVARLRLRHLRLV